MTASSIQFIPLTDRTHADQLIPMMRMLYQEDPAGHPISDENAPRTIHHLLAHPDAGTIILFLTSDKSLAGYAILIPYWSNEFAGNLLFIDELFVHSSHRGQGIAKRFLNHLKSHPPANTSALALEVTPTNAKARALYESLGFAKRKNDMLVCRLG